MDGQVPVRFAKHSQRCILLVFGRPRVSGSPGGMLLETFNDVVLWLTDARRL